MPDYRYGADEQVRVWFEDCSLVLGLENVYKLWFEVQNGGDFLSE